MSPIRCILFKASGTGKFSPITDPDKLVAFDALPIGAMYDAYWKKRKGIDGKSLYVIIPGPYAWFIDGRCSNCTRMHDTVHYCWIRHGDPPNITVDKNGYTCSAGAGSISVPNWHGYLQNGYLRDA